MEYSKTLNDLIIVSQHTCSDSFVKRLVQDHDKTYLDFLNLRVKETQRDVVFLFFKELYKWQDRIINEMLDNFDNLHYIYFIIIDRIHENPLIKAWESRKYKDHPNWTYCIPLLSNQTYKEHEEKVETIYDLSVCFTFSGWSANIVHSNKEQDYLSGGSSGEFWLSDAKRKDLLKLMIQFGIKSEDYYKELENHNNIMKMFMDSDKDIWELTNFLNQQ